jgi:hypothetical protein
MEWKGKVIRRYKRYYVCMNVHDHRQITPDRKRPRILESNVE